MCSSNAGRASLQRCTRKCTSIPPCTARRSRGDSFCQKWRGNSGENCRPKQDGRAGQGKGSLSGSIFSWTEGASTDMNDAKSPEPQIKPVAVFLDRGKVITQEFVSRDGHVLAGYRTILEAAGFPAWERRGNLVNGFRETSLCWFPTEDAARVWVLARVSGENQSAHANDAISSGPQRKAEAA